MIQSLQPGISQTNNYRNKPVFKAYVEVARELLPNPQNITL